MARRRGPVDRMRDNVAADPLDPLGGLVVAGAVEGGSWALGRLRDRLLRRQKPMDPETLPMAPSPQTPSGNVRVSQTPPGP